MIAAAVIRVGIIRRQREAAARQQREATETRRKREQDHWKAVEDARLRALSAQQHNSHSNENSRPSNLDLANNVACSTRAERAHHHEQAPDQVEVQSCEACRLLASLSDGAGVTRFSARPMLLLSGTFAPGPRDDTVRITFGERPSDLNDADAVRFALRCLSLLASRTAAIDRACAHAAARGEAPPPELVCPITLCVMRDPVVAADGHAYERAAITAWLSRRRCSPLTNCTMESPRLSPHDALRRSIDCWARDTLAAPSAVPSGPG